MKRSLARILDERRARRGTTHGTLRAVQPRRVLEPLLREPSPSPGNGLVGGETLTVEDLAAYEAFEGNKRPFRMKLARNLGLTPDGEAPSIRAVVRRRVPAGDVICRAGDFGASAFLLVEGEARAFVPDEISPSAVRGRTRASLAALRELFRKRTGDGDEEPDLVAVGELTRYAAMPARRPRTEILRPGELFGLDACMNFYPRERTVEAVQDCVVIEMLRSVLDTIRDSGEGGGRIVDGYRAHAVRASFDLIPMFDSVDADLMEWLAERSELLTSGSDAVREGVLFEHGETADSVYVLRTGTVQFRGRPAQNSPILGYLGRGALFGLEAILPPSREGPLQLECTSHPDRIAPTVIGEGITLGRSRAADVVFPAEDRTIGRRHCRIERRGDDLYLVHLGSVNPTRLDGLEIQEARVKEGARIQFQGYVFRVGRGPAPPPDLTMVSPRIATATGLGEFEVVRIPAAPLNEVLAKTASEHTFTGALTRSMAALTRDRVAMGESAGALSALGLHTAQNVLLIDLDRCTRCDECVRACADVHDGVSRFTRDGPRLGRHLVTMACRSCADPKCMVGCPVGSIRRLDSLEVKIEDWCIGCERCANQCPYRTA